MSHPPKFYKLPQLAEATGLSVIHFRRMCNTGELKAIKAGSGSTSPWIVREDWFNQWAEDNLYNPAA